MNQTTSQLKSSITSKITLLLVICLFSIISFGTVFSYLVQKSELFDERNSHAEDAITRLAFTMSSPLWNFDLEQLDKLAQAEMKGEGSLAVLLWTADDRLLLEKVQDKQLVGKWTSPAKSNTIDRREFHLVTSEIRRGQQLLGTLMIVYGDNHINAALGNLLKHEVIKAFFLLATTGVVLYLGLSRILLKRLNEVCLTAVEFANGKLSRRIKVSENDELGILSNTYNQMADRISDKINQLESAYDEVKQLQGVLDDIINSMPSVIIVVNQQLEVLLCNNSAEKLMEAAALNARGKNITLLLPQFSVTLLQLFNGLDKKGSYQSEKVTIRINNVQSNYLVQIFPMSSEAYRQAVVRIDDITEHARLEEIMIQNEKMTMVGGLAAGMAHEINNPLAAMLQNTQNIERRLSAGLAANRTVAEESGINLDSVAIYLDKRGIPGFLTQIREAGSRIAKIISTMLRFTNKTESGRQTVELSNLIEQIIELAANDYEMKKDYNFNKITIIREFDSYVPPVQVTVSEIEHVLFNILKNAAQSMSSTKEDRHPQILIRIRKEGGMSVIDIEDNGQGMRVDIQRKIFEPFYSTREVGEGTGLGLSIAYAIITNNYNGKIEVESVAGKRTCFTISIPSIGSNL
jgi:signal transduction histidine kinase